MPAQIIVVFVLVAFALTTGVVLLLAPRSEIPLERRRPARAAEPGNLSKWTTRITTFVDGVLNRRGSGALDTALERAGVKMPAKDVVFLAGCAMVLLASAGFLFGNLAAALVAPALVPVGLKVALSVLKGRRQKKFMAQLEETTQLLSGQLRAGYSFNQALAAVADESESPSSEEFARINSELRLGRNLADALEACAERMESPDFKMLGEAVAINREVGGNLAEVIDKTGETLRMRAELHRRVQTLASEGKIQALVLMALPILMALFLGLTQPAFFAPMFETVIGLIALAVIVVMLVIGGLWMKKIIEIKY